MATQPATGWFSRAVTDTVTVSTTGTLVLPLPARTADGDILIMSLAHKGGAFATVPVDWTLIERLSSDTVFGEMYWKRASSEGATYNVTGLGAIGRGVIRAYGGGLTVGDVVSASVVRANTGADPGSPLIRPGWPALSVADDRSLLVGMAAIRDTSTTPFLSCQANFPPAINRSLLVNDKDLSSLTIRASATGAAGAALYVIDAMKIVAGDTGEGSASGALTPNVCILAAFIPEEEFDAASTRLYMTSRNLGVEQYGVVDGDWRSSFGSPDCNRTFQVPTWELSTRKSDAGRLVFGSGTSGFANLSQANCNEKEVGVLFYRGRFGPLAAQELTGTMDVLTSVVGAWVEGNTPGASEVVYQVHAYISDGDSLDVREVILNNFRDTGGTVWSAVAAYTALSAAQAVSGTIEEGDYIVVELGAYIVDSPNPVAVEQYPAEDYTRMFLLRGATNNSADTGDGGVGVPTIDATTSPPIASTVPYIEFSQALELAAASGTPPTNVSCATATEIPSLPYVPAVIDTTQVPSANRKLWWKWTADEACRISVLTWGTNYAVDIQSFIVADCASMTGLNNSIATVVCAADVFGFWSQTSRVYDLTEGQTIFFSVFTTAVRGDRNLAGNSVGGSLKFKVVKYSAPQNNDVFTTVNGNVICLRDGEVVNLSTWTGFGGGVLLLGNAIDYTKRPLDTYAGGAPNETDRLLVGLFSSEFVMIVDVPTLGLGPVGAADQEELANIFPESSDGPLGNGQINMSSLAVNAAGALAVGYWGNGFQYIGSGIAGGSTPTAFLDRAAGTSPATAVSAYVNLTDAIYAEPMPETWPPATEAPATVDQGGVGYLEYSIDGTIIYYTSGGWYLPTNPSYKIMAIDAATGAQLPEFATVPAGTGPLPSVKGIFPLLDGGMLVCNGSIVQRLDAAGAVTQTYAPTPPERAESLADVELTSDGDAFWVLDMGSSSLFKFDLESGAQLDDVWLQIGPGNANSIVVYRVEAYPADVALRITQLPLNILYAFDQIAPFVTGDGVLWRTPPRNPGT